MDHEGMVSMFEALLATGLSGFLGCSLNIFEAALVEFFHNDSVSDGMVVSTVQGKPLAISEELFAGTFELPLEGLTDLHEENGIFYCTETGLREPLRSGEDDDMSRLKQPSKIIERRSDISTIAECFVEEPVETEDHGKEIEAVATSIEGKTLDDESLSIDDLLATISADAMLPSVTAAEITIIQFERCIEIREVQEGYWC
ncbi:hypothetical protein F511_27992 [Dorcoceras hygrometricum]|uniref:Uncharacterized protein n=1 Tax=Dorcoceras hygrometricum TaxID=472368 RepID=A0A2Z7AJR3_9LAMI|nr:hypothetical protein F511_27992 [Dorcoceras hygrometricum]